MGGPAKHQSGYYATCYSLPWVGQRSGRRPANSNKTLLWVVSGCAEYSFDVDEVGDVDTKNCECVGGQRHGQ